MYYINITDKRMKTNKIQIVKYTAHWLVSIVTYELIIISINKSFDYSIPNNIKINNNTFSLIIN